MSYLTTPDEATADGDTARRYDEDRTSRGYVANFTRLSPRVDANHR